jgi:Predicted amidohydrolase
MIKSFRLALCQMDVVDCKQTNVAKALQMLDKAAGGGAAVAVLPEMFNCPYDNKKFGKYAESMPDSPTAGAITKKAAELGIYVVAGSIPERDGTSLYNTCFVYGREGQSLAGIGRSISLISMSKGK